MEDARLLQLPEKDVDGLNLGRVVSCCMAVKLNGAVHKIYVRPAILYGSDAWYLK